MLRKLSKSIREYKRPTVLTLVFIVLEAIIECIIPFVTAKLVNHIREGAAMSEVITTGAILLVMAVASLACGGLAGLTCAKASAGFSKNLRHDLFYRIQGFSFANIDRFSTSSLVTRMTTDVNNVQMAFMMLISVWALVILIKQKWGNWILVSVSFILLMLALALIALAINVLFRKRTDASEKSN